MGLAETAQLAVQLDLKGNFREGLRSASQALQGFDKHTSNTQQALGKFGHNIQRGIVLGTTAAAAGFVAVAKAAGDFEAQLNTINTVANLSAGDLKGVGDSLRKISTTTGLALDDLTNGYYDLVSAGVKGKLAQDALNDAVKLGIGGLATTAEAVDLLTTAINAYSLDSAGAAKATDQFALAVADGKVKADQIAATFSNVASVAKAYGVGIDQIATSYAFLTAQGVDASEVTTEMQRAIISLVKPTKDLEVAQKKLGISFTTEIRKKGLVPALQELREYSDKTGVPLIALLGRIEAVKYTLQTTGSNFAGFNTELDKMGKASGTAAAQMAERQKGLNFQLSVLRENIRSAAITIGSALLPKLTPLIQKLNEFISANAGKIADFGDKLASGFEKFATALGKVDWQPFIDGLRISSDIAKRAIDLFMSLPNEVKAVAIGAFAVNKVTGGLPAAIVKDVGGGIINQLAGRGSSPANPLWVAQVGGPGGLPIAGAGLLATVLPVATIAASVIGPVVVAKLLSDRSSSMATGISNQVNQQLNSGASLKDLQTSLAAIDTGINELQANPLNVLVQGDALDQLKAQRQLIQQQIDKGLDSPAHIGSAIADRLLDSPLGKISPATIGAGIKAGLSNEFAKMISALHQARKPEDIRKAVEEAVRIVIGQSRGNVGGTTHVLAELRKQLHNTHDPKLAAELRSAIAKVERKVAGREFAAKELTAVNRLVSDGKITPAELRKIAGIEQALKDRGLPKAAQAIKDKLHAAQVAITRAEGHTAATIRRKRLSVTVNNTTITNVSVSPRDVFNGQKHSSRYFSTIS